MTAVKLRSEKYNGHYIQFRKAHIPGLRDEVYAIIHTGLYTSGDDYVIGSGKTKEAAFKAAKRHIDAKLPYSREMKFKG